MIAQLLSYPIGKFWALYMPDVKFFGIAFNPGPFTLKEHVLITIMANVGFQSAYAVGDPNMCGRTRANMLYRPTSSPYSVYSTVKDPILDTSGYW